MVGRRVQFADETWEAVEAVMRASGLRFQQLAKRGFWGLSAKVWSAGRAKGGAQGERGQRKAAP